MGEIPKPLQERIDSLGIPLLGVVPVDQDLIQAEISGTPMVDLDDDSPIYRAVEGMMEKLAISQ